MRVSGWGRTDSGPNLGVAVLKPHDLGAGCSPFLNLFVHLDHLKVMKSYGGFLRSQVKNAQEVRAPRWLPQVLARYHD